MASRSVANGNSQAQALWHSGLQLVGNSAAMSWAIHSFGGTKSKGCSTVQQRGGKPVHVKTHGTEKMNTG